MKNNFKKPLIDIVKMNSENILAESTPFGNDLKGCIDEDDLLEGDD